MIKKLLFALCCMVVFGQNVSAQLMAIPPHASAYSGSVRGYWFTAPCAFTITGLKVSPEAGTGTQYIHVMKINDAVPVIYSVNSSNFTTLAYIQNAPNNVVQTVSISVNTGDIIGILGSTGSTTAQSYSAPATPFATTINGMATSLYRLLYQGTIISGPAPNYSWEQSAAISRIEMYYSVGPPVAPNCVSAPVSPANGATGICSGTKMLVWNKVSGATGYDVYFNTGGTATTLVSTNQVDTFYNATTSIGLHSWKIVPRNVTGLATGCNTFNFTTVAGITPTAEISISPNDTVCVNVPVTLTATITNGGTAPVYQWKRNNVNVGTNSPTYTDNAVLNNNNYKVVVTSNSTGCLTSATATSGQINVVILPTPVSTITPAGPTAFCQGGSVLLNAISGAASYQWLANNTPIATATNSSYVAMYSGYYKVLTTSPSNTCPSISDSVRVTVYQTPVPHINRTGNVLSTATYYANYQWYRDGHAISGATANTYTFANDGMFQVKVTDTAGCGGFSAYAPVNNLAVNGVSANDVRIYPNPAKEALYINAPVVVNVSVRSMDGKLVLRQNNATKLNIEKLATGVYSLYVTDKDDNLITVEKFTKTN